MDIITVNVADDIGIDRASEALSDVVKRGGTANSLTDEQLELLLAELVRIRHARMDPGIGYQSKPAYATVLVQLGDRVTIGSIGTRLDRDEHGHYARDFCDVALGVRAPDAI